MDVSSYYIGKPYTVKPSSIRFDQTWIEYNRKYNAIEYASIKDSIKTRGQIEPIAINSETGLCEDGRTRAQICTELGIDVLCVQINGALDVAARRDIYMRNDTGREYNTAQKAVKAYQYMLLTNCKTIVAAKKHKVTDRDVNYAVTIAGLKRQDILDAIINDGVWEGSKSMRTIASKLKKEEEVVEIEYADTPKIEYEDMINTETGKAEYWKLLNIAQLSPHELKMLAVNYVNLKYKLVVNETTGEVTEPT